MARGYTLGAVDFVFAPVVPAIMRAKVSVFVELYRAQQELKRYRAQLETLVQERTVALTAINRELEAFSHSISHDLRSPLVSFDKLSRQMLENHAAQLDEPARQSLERMRDASRRMTLVFDGLETLFKLTSGEIRRADVDLTAMANDIVARQRERQPERKVRVDIAPEMVVNGDPRLVRMLVETLIDNAWKFTGPKPDAHITVGQEIVDGESRTFVKDDGVGYDMIDSHRLFGAFQRLHTQAEFPGIGIGLAIARRIVNRHGGRIWAEGAAGEGAAFYFIL
jgi:light-regulated signal transduction histidine kinase (bacteriophytochrome)